jgi:hypothetical protein
MREALAHLGTIKVVGPDGIELAVELRKADEGTIARDRAVSAWSGPMPRISVS